MPHMPRNRDKMSDVDAETQATCLDSGHKGCVCQMLNYRPTLLMLSMVQCLHIHSRPLVLKLFRLYWPSFNQ